MPKGSLSVSLKGADDIFSTEESRQEQQREQVQQIPIGELFPFKDHPFKVLDDESMQRTVESVEQYGVLSPLIARPRPEGGYEIISGHRRQHAAQLAGLDTLPVIVRNMDDDAAVLLMVDSNLQRENILPSERAFAYKMKLEALKNQGARSDLTSGQIGPKLRSDEQVALDAGESRKQVQRFIRLTCLIPELLDMVDEKKIAFNPAVELSYLDEAQQRDFLEAMNDTQNAPSLSQAQRLKKLVQEENTLSVLKIAPGQYPQQVEIDNDLKALQQAVGGSIGASYPFEDPVAIVYNDDGKLMGLPLNRALRDENGQMYDVIAGTFLVVGLGEEDFASLTPELAQKHEQLFHQPEAFLKLGNRLLVLPVPDEPPAEKPRTKPPAEHDR